MRTLVFVTNNSGKLQEALAALQGKIKVLSLHDVSCHEDIPETQKIIEGNAFQKALYVHRRYGCECISDDTGLEINSLNGRPGVFSARYAGIQCSPQANMRKVLGEMKNLRSREARFRTIISVIVTRNDKSGNDGRIYHHQFEGILNGTITEKCMGAGGFGYDPIFRPLESNLTLAEMTLEEKNKISHRAKALKLLVDFFCNTKALIN